MCSESTALLLANPEYEVYSNKVCGQVKSHSSYNIVHVPLRTG